MKLSLIEKKATGVLFFCLLLVIQVKAQSGASYEVLPAPDLWYNDVDGIRIGARVLGQVPGTFEDGPHRLDAGVWFHTWTPEIPVSYYLSFTEPIPAISDFNSEGNVRLESSIRTGLSRHSLTFSKRWQKGFEASHFIKVSAGIGVQKRFDREYVPFPVFWQEEWLGLAALRLQVRNTNVVGSYFFQSSLEANLAGPFSRFVNGTAQFQQLLSLGSGFEARGRIFTGLSSVHTAPEFLFTHSLQPAIDWINSGLTRAKGTIPTPWMESGAIQISGGAGLRGYTGQDIESLSRGGTPLYTSMGAASMELDYPNPVDRGIRKVPFVGEFVKLRSYLFFDAGTSLGLTRFEERRTLSDAGMGFMFSINIPDYLGNPRGIMIRYDLPLWLSHPAGKDHFSYRGIVGIGAVFSI